MKSSKTPPIVQVIACVLVMSTVVGAWETPQTNPEAQEPEERSEIVLGMSTALKGPAQDLGKNMLSGVLAGFDRVNRKGGVHGRMIRVIALDDGYEPKNTAPNMDKLIDEEDVLAVIGNVGTPTAIAAIPVANAKKTVLFAPFTGAGVLRKDPPDRYIINYRASYAQETTAMIDALMGVGGLKVEDIAFFTQRDGYGDAGFNGGVQALMKHGLRNSTQVLHTRYERNTLAVEKAVAEILMAEMEPRAIIMVGAYAPCAKFIRLLKENDMNPLFLNVSFVGSKSLAGHLGMQGQGVIITQVVPHYASSLPLVKDYLDDLQKSGSLDMPSFGGLEGYIAARIFSVALEKIEGVPDRENIVDALEALGEFDMGLGKPLRLDKQTHQASNQVWPTIIRIGQVVPFAWEELENGHN